MYILEMFKFQTPEFMELKRSDPDMPGFNKAVSGESSKQYVEAMKKISALIHQNTWITVLLAKLIILLSLHGLSN